MIAPVQPPPDRDSPPPDDVQDGVSAARDPWVLEEVGALTRETLGERVTAELRALLVAGRLAPGEKLSLRRVAEALGGAMMPVREAVSRVAADGALEELPGRAVRVPMLTLGQFRELTRLRLVVEASGRKEPQCSGVRVLAQCHAVMGEAANVRKRDTLGDAACLRAIVGCQPVAVCVNRDPELTIDTLRRPHAVAAEITGGAVLHKALEVRIQRRLALGARGHRAVAEQRMYF